jgi:hypothetical protein
MISKSAIRAAVSGCKEELKGRALVAATGLWLDVLEKGAQNFISLELVLGVRTRVISRKF